MIFRRMWPSAAWVTVAAVAVAVLVAWRVGLRDPDPGAGRSAGDVAATGSRGTGLTTFPPGKRPAAPSLRGGTLDGAQFALSDLRGHVVVINVWGSWCGPCRAETPELVRIAREKAGRGVRFVGVETRDNPDSGRAFVRTFKVPYPSLIDRDGEVLLGFNGLVPLSAVPSTAVVDPDGMIAAVVIGRVRCSTLTGLLDDVLAESAAPATRHPSPQPAGAR